ncbi:TPA: papain-like cysteine protease family protein [Aeromonas salmonicida]
MKLFIDNEQCNTSSILAHYRTPRIEGESVTLELSLALQEKANWCWAAIVLSLADYFDLGACSQSGIAGLCEPDANKDRQNGERLPLNQALDAVGCQYYWTPGKPSFPRLMAQINHGLPLCARIQWHCGLGHFVLIYGYQASPQMLWVADSNDGSSLQGFNDFPKNYGNRSGVWTETYWMLRPGEKADELF